MNCPSRTEEPEGDGFNQNPSSLSADLTTRQDLNGIANARELRRIASNEIESEVDRAPDEDRKREKGGEVVTEAGERGSNVQMGAGPGMVPFDVAEGGSGGSGRGNGRNLPLLMRTFLKILRGVKTYGKFVGPGFMVGVPLENFLILFVSNPLADFSGIH